MYVQFTSCVYWVILIGLSTRGTRGVLRLRAIPNIYDEAFLRKQLTTVIFTKNFIIDAYRKSFPETPYKKVPALWWISFKKKVCNLSTPFPSFKVNPSPKTGILVQPLLLESLLKDPSYVPKVPSSFTS